MGCGRKKPKRRILVLGLDHSGKTTMVERLKMEAAHAKAMRKQKKKKGEADRSSAVVAPTAPTVGYQESIFAHKGVKLTSFDMSGSAHYRHLWEHYFEEVNGLVFVIDAADRGRFGEVADCPAELLVNEKFEENQAPILFLANKMDLPGAAEANEIVNGMNLNIKRIRNRAWNVSATNSLTGEGLLPAFAWLSDQMAP